MHKNLEKIYTERIAKFGERINKSIIGDSIQLDAEYFKTSNPVLFKDRLNGEYLPIKEGDVWGEAWDNAWFHLRGKIPESWAGKKISAVLNFTGEGLVFDSAGTPIQGLTSSSVYNKEFKRELYPILETCSGGEEIDLWIEAVSIGYLGVNLPFDPDPSDSERYGEFKSYVNTIRIAVFKNELWHLWLDIFVLGQLIQHLPTLSVRRSRILKNVNKMIDAFKDDLSNAAECREMLQSELSKPASASDLSVIAVGHAHIDTAWLWPVSETRRKIARTFSNQLSLLEKYPEYIFGASQPQHYCFLKQDYPQLFDSIKKYVDEGRWELQGGMWVEADTNLISGESLIRQIIHGKNYFKDEFNYEVKNLWLPDVFGYSAALPQILKKSGIDYFLTQKISWNQINEFPHNTFYWRGIDGTEVLSHFPPENNYNSYLSPEYLLKGRDNFKEKDTIDEFISLFGVGNGGGGPKSESIEFGKRMSDLEGVPKVRFGRSDDFFENLSKYASELPIWDGELYLELHRGTLTSQAKIKKLNRMLELQLRELEILYSCLRLDKYPIEDLDGIWKKVLINQFHDIIPGSSINATYKNTVQEYEQALAECSGLRDNAASLLFSESDDSLVLFNSLSCKYSGVIILPEDWKSGLKESNGKAICMQREERGLTAYVEVEPLSFVTLYKDGEIDVMNNPAKDLILENDLVRYEFNKNGRLIDAYDKQMNTEIITEDESGNLFSLYDDHPLEWDAWDVDIYYEASLLENGECLAAEDYCDGKVRKGLRFQFQIGNSKIDQLVFLNNSDKRLDFETAVEWNEKHKMLRVSFPVNIKNTSAAFDIQYGFIYRNTHRNTSWDTAKFEVCGHKYADLSNGNYGVALLNNCKYGYKVLNNVIDLNLLRSPNYPDPDADVGLHEFTYSLLPHKGDLIHSDVIAQASCLNQGILSFSGFKAFENKVPCSTMGEGISLEQIKKAEKEDCLIIRLVETRGAYSKSKLCFHKYPAAIAETNLIEWETGEKKIISEDMEVQMKPFEIRTYKYYV